MEMRTNPPFIPKDAHGDLALGFHSRHISLDDIDQDRLVSSPDPWDRFAGILKSCASGDFSRLESLFPLLNDTDEYLLWRAGTNLVASAGNWSVVRKFVGQYQPFSLHEDAGEIVAAALGLSCDLRAVDLLIELHEASSDEDTRIEIEGELSNLLEPDEGLLWTGARPVDHASKSAPDGVDREAYFGHVRSLHHPLVSELSQTTKVFEGQIYDVIAVAKRLCARLQQSPISTERVLRERLILEASAGIDCTAFFAEDRQLISVAGIAVIEDFLESDAVQRFSPGRRYFFGHPVPE
jgi:hypothetical protein